MNDHPPDPANVNIWIGSEWPPLREAVTGALSTTSFATGEEITLVAESAKPNSLPGRIARWISTAPPLAGIRIEIVDAGERAPTSAVTDRVVFGVTELLLDPDPAQADQLYAIGLWTRLIHRRQRLLMRVTPYLSEEIVANAAAAQPDLLIQIAEWRGQHLIMMSRDLIAAEVVGRAVRSLAQPAGDIGLNPWETEIVRLASERALGVTSGDQMSIVVTRAGPAPPAVVAEFLQLIQAVANLVDCAVNLPD